MKRFSRIITGVTVTLLLSQAAQTLAAEEIQESATTQTLMENKSSVGAFPVMFYSDETRFAAGGGAQVMMGGESERFSSSFGLMAFVTQNRQYTFIIAPELYLKDDTYKMTGNFGYSYFPDSFYGIGNNTDKDNEEKYTGRLCKINPILQRKIRPNLFIGIQYDYAYGKVVKSENGGRLASGRVPGSEGGGASGAGINITWDSRDNNVYPLSGSFHQVIASSYGSTLGSDYTFNSYLIDLRYYRQVFGSHVIAFQGISCINTGQPSFQYMNDVSSLGKYLRGYTQTQFVDKNVLAFQTEYRMPLYGRFGLVVFAGFGQVSEKLDTIAFDEFKPSAGMGLRFALIPEQKVNLRIDMGMGKDNSSFDISLMETF
ncbi:outer membrane protein assembly factor [bacterium]|nr:outer membrane protein assembly factor [bacterium]